MLKKGFKFSKAVKNLFLPMPNYKVTLDTKDKRTEECQCTNFEELNNWIDKTFNMEVKNIKYKRPRLKVNSLFLQKDEASFAK